MHFTLAGNMPFASLYNTNTVVLIAFLVFVAFLVFKVKIQNILGNLLDKRSEGIKSELDEAKKLREEAQEIFAEYERKLKEVQVEADQIVANAKSTAQKAADEAKVKLEQSIERRIAAGKDQIASAEATVERGIRTRATQVAIETAQKVIAENLSAKDANGLIDASIADVAEQIN